ncbi:MAG: carboxylesterase [Chromatiales bacterium]|jgi:phospholipase/carboxylesterase
MIEQLETIEVQTGAEPRHSVIWLHGLGADGHDFEPIVGQLGLPRGAAVRFVFPHAPVRPVTINGGIPMRAWFDILGIDRSAVQDEAGIRDSAERVRRLIDRECDRGIAERNIVLAGFSQGGAIALHLGLRRAAPLAGIMALSCYLPLTHRLAAEHDPAMNTTPVFVAHGSGDPVIPIGMGRAAYEAVAGLGILAEWHEYPMPHAVCPEEIRDIAGWLGRVFDFASA